ncbi:hypothetical protein IJS77_04690 [bacterium]|nr:hypothetical protein [bacterium]
MLKELVNDILLRNRPEKQTVRIYGNYGAFKDLEAVYSDNSKNYLLKEAENIDRIVHSKKAFVALIKEELRRNNNIDGDFATVRLNLKGGDFVADDKFYEGKFDYTRLLSEQFDILRNSKNRVYDHEEFLNILRALKPSIVGFQEVYRKFSKIRIIGRSEMTSNPIFIDDKSESGYKCTYKLTDRTEEDATLPSSFEVLLPFAKAGEMLYKFPVELLFYNTNGNEIMVKIQIPEFETIVEQAIIDEAEEIKEELKEHSKLLVLADF